MCVDVIIVSLITPSAVFAQVLAGFRYGRDDLDVLGLNFRRDLIDVSQFPFSYKLKFSVQKFQAKG